MRKYIVRGIVAVMVTVASIGLVFLGGILLKVLMSAFLTGWNAIGL